MSVETISQDVPEKPPEEPSNMPIYRLPDIECMKAYVQSAGIDVDNEYNGDVARAYEASVFGGVPASEIGKQAVSKLNY